MIRRPPKSTLTDTLFPYTTLFRCQPVLAPLMIKMGAAKVPASWYRMPIYYKSNRFSVNGHDGVVQWPRYSHVMDFELEFGFFLGKKGKNIKPSEDLRSEARRVGYEGSRKFMSRGGGN